MTDPFRLTVMKALTACLQEITPANGYQHDLSPEGHVTRGRLLLTQEDPLPLIAINEPPKHPDEIEMPSAGQTKSVRHALLIQGFVEDDREHPTDPAYRLMADVQKRLVVERQRSRGYDILGLGARVMGLHIGQGVVRPPEALVSDNAFFWLPVTLEYAEDLQNPFV